MGVPGHRGRHRREPGRPGLDRVRLRGVRLDPRLDRARRVRGGRRLRRDHPRLLRRPGPRRVPRDPLRPDRRPLRGEHACRRPARPFVRDRHRPRLRRRAAPQARCASPGSTRGWRPWSPATSRCSSSTTTATARCSRRARRRSRAGSDTLVLGCMSMAFLGVAERLSEELGVPVLNPARTALKTAEGLVEQRHRAQQEGVPRAAEGRRRNGRALTGPRMKGESVEATVNGARLYYETHGDERRTRAGDPARRARASATAATTSATTARCRTSTGCSSTTRAAPAAPRTGRPTRTSSGWRTSTS